MLNKIYLFIATLLIPFNLFAAKEAAKAKVSKKSKYHFEETVHLPLPHLYLSKWQVGYQNSNKAGTTVTRYFLDNESKENWSQIVNIQFKDKKHLKGINVEKIVQEEATKSSWVNSKFHSKEENDFIYEREFPTGEHELVRMILTQKGLHRVAYVKRGPLSQEEREQWIERLANGVVKSKEQKTQSKKKT